MGQNHLGLGVEMGLDDNFSGPATTILGYFKQLEEAVDNFVNNFNRAGDAKADFDLKLSDLHAILEAGRTITELGNQFYQFGTDVAEALAAVAEQMFSTGQQFERYRAQLATLFHETTLTGFAKTEEELRRIELLAKRTPFDVPQLVQASIAFKTVGIDPYKMYEDRQGNLREMILFAGDLAGAMGKTIKEAQYAIKEAATGNWRSLAMRFDTPLKQIEAAIGRTLSTDMGTAGMQDRIDGIIEYIKLKYGGGMEQLAATTEGMLSNLGDHWTLFKKRVGDAGFMKEIKSSISGVLKTFDNLAEGDTLNELAKVTSDALLTVVKPLTRGVELATDFFIKFSKFAAEHPSVLKISVGIVGMIAALTLGSGKIMQVSGAIIQMAAAFAIMNMQAGVSGVASLSTVLRNITPLLTGVIFFFLKIAAVAGVLYFVWNRDLFGIRTKVMEWYDTVKEAFKEVDELHKSTSMAEYIEKWKGLSDVAKLIEKVQVGAEALFTALFGRGTIDVDLYDKLDAIGLLEFVEDVLYAKYQIEQFFTGLARGIEDFWSVAGPVVNYVGDAFTHISNALAEVLPGLKDLSEVDASKFEKMGHSIGILLGVFATYKVGSTIWGIVSALYGLASSEAVVTAATWLFNLALWANPVTWIVIGVLALGAALIYVATHWEESKAAFLSFMDAYHNGFQDLAPWLRPIVNTLVGVFIPLIGVPMLLAEGWFNFKIAFVNVINGVIDKWNNFMTQLQTIWDGIRKIPGLGDKLPEVQFKTLNKISLDPGPLPDELKTPEGRLDSSDRTSSGSSRSAFKDLVDMSSLTDLLGAVEPATPTGQVPTKIRANSELGGSVDNRFDFSGLQVHLHGITDLSKISRAQLEDLVEQIKREAENKLTRENLQKFNDILVGG